MYSKVKNSCTTDKHKIIVIPSYRTPQNIIKMAYNSFSHDHIVFKEVDKKAYLSGLSIAKFLVVTCDSTSMISEAALTGKPIYVAQMPTIKKNHKFKDFFNLFESLNIIKNLGAPIENWNYQKLDETQRVSSYIKDKIEKHDFS